MARAIRPDIPGSPAVPPGPQEVTITVHVDVPSGTSSAGFVVAYRNGGREKRKLYQGTSVSFEAQWTQEGPAGQVALLQPGREEEWTPVQNSFGYAFETSLTARAWPSSASSIPSAPARPEARLANTEYEFVLGQHEPDTFVQIALGNSSGFDPSSESEHLFFSSRAVFEGPLFDYAKARRVNAAGASEWTEVSELSGRSGLHPELTSALPTLAPGDSIDLNKYGRGFSDVRLYSFGRAAPSTSEGVLSAGSEEGLFLARLGSGSQKPVWTGAMILSGSQGETFHSSGQIPRGTPLPSGSNSLPDSVWTVARQIPVSEGKTSRHPTGVAPAVARAGASLVLSENQPGPPSPQLPTGLGSDDAVLFESWHVRNGLGLDGDQFFDTRPQGTPRAVVRSGELYWLEPVKKAESRPVAQPSVYRGQLLEDPQDKSLEEAGQNQWRYRYPSGLGGFPTEETTPDILSLSAEATGPHSIRVDYKASFDGEIVSVEIPVSLGGTEVTSYGRAAFTGLVPDTQYSAEVLGSSVSARTNAADLQAEATGEAVGGGFRYELSASGNADEWRFLLSSDPQSTLSENEKSDIEKWRTGGVVFTDEARRGEVLLEARYSDGTQKTQRLVTVFDRPQTHRKRNQPVSLGTIFSPPETSSLSFRVRRRSGRSERLTKGRVWPAGTLRVETIEAHFPPEILPEGAPIESELAGAELVGPAGENLGRQAKLTQPTFIRVRLWARASEKGKSPSVYSASLSHIEE